MYTGRLHWQLQEQAGKGQGGEWGAVVQAPRFRGLQGKSISASSGEEKPVQDTGFPVVIIFLFSTEFFKCDIFTSLFFPSGYK